MDLPIIASVVAALVCCLVYREAYGRLRSGLFLLPARCVLIADMRLRSVVHVRFAPCGSCRGYRPGIVRHFIGGCIGPTHRIIQAGGRAG